MFIWTSLGKFIAFFVAAQRDVQEGSCPYQLYVLDFVATGSLVSVKIMRNKSTQVSLGYGFLEFSSHDAANTVLATYNGKAMPGTNNVFRQALIPCLWTAAFH